MKRRTMPKWTNETATYLENLMPSGRQRAHSEINNAESNHVLDGRVSSREMKIV